MGAALTRRDFLEHVFGAALGGALFACSRGQPTRELPGSLLGQDASAGHLLRAPDLHERVQHVRSLEPLHTSVAIAGGGPAGLSAAYGLRRAGQHDFVLLELEAVPGGTSRGDASHVSAYPWGAHYLPVPRAEHGALVSLLEEMNVMRAGEVLEPHLVRAPEERLFYKGYWYPGLYLEAGASQADLAERARFLRTVSRWVEFRDEAGRRAFTLPSRLCSDAPALRALDTIDAASWLAREGYASPRLLWLLDYACRDDYGLTLAQTSAWSLLFYYASRVDGPGDEAADLITWPDGNYALVRHLAAVAGDAVKTRMLVLDVREDERGVSIAAWDLTRDRGVHYRGRRAIVATPSFLSQRIAPSAQPAPSYGSWLVANLHLTDRPTSHGAQLAWDNVLHDSPALGYVCATHQRGSDYGPTVLTYYLPLCDDDPRRARQKLYDGDLRTWQEAVLLDLGRAHPGLRELVARCDVFRWGHAMPRATVGARFATVPPRTARISYAHSDLSALPLFEEAFDHGLRAAREVQS